MADNGIGWTRFPRGDAFFPEIRMTFREHAVPIVGITALLAWMEALLCFEGVLRDDVMYGGGIVHDPFFVGFALFGALGCATSVLVSRYADRPMASCALEGRPALYTAGVFGIVGTLGAALGVLCAESMPPWLSFACGACCGAACAWMLLRFCGIFAELDLRQTLVALMPTFSLQWAVMIVIPVMPLIVRPVFVAILLFVSIISVARSCGSDAEEHGTPVNARTAVRLFRMVAAAFILSTIVQFLITYFVHGIDVPLDPAAFSMLFFFVMVAVFAVFAMIIRIMNSMEGYRVDLFYRTFFVICLACIGSIGIARSWHVASYIGMYIAFSLMVPVLIILALGISAVAPLNARQSAGEVLGSMFLGQLVGFACAIALGSSNARLEGFIVLLCLMAVGIAYAFVFPESMLERMMPHVLKLERATLERRCEEVARRFELSPRETEVLVFLARGRDAAYVAERLTIAKSTVTTHRKSIYRKLGVHTQQQLLSVVDGEDLSLHER